MTSPKPSVDSQVERDTASRSNAANAEENSVRVRIFCDIIASVYNGI
jgi:hypothetical protein